MAVNSELHAINYQVLLELKYTLDVNIHSSSSMVVSQLAKPRTTLNISYTFTAALNLD